MGFLRRAFGFVLHPSHSRTLGLVIMLVLVAAVSLTVYVAQQQQETRQRASEGDSPSQCFDKAAVWLEQCKKDYKCESTSCVEKNCVPSYQAMNIYCASLPTPTPFKITNCGNFFCDSNKNEKCLIEGQFGNEPITYSCATPTPTQVAIAPTPTPTKTPTTKKGLGENCLQTQECESGLICEFQGSEEFGYFVCASAIPTSTPTPTPTKIPTPTPNCTQQCTNQKTKEFDFECYKKNCEAPIPTLAPTLPPQTLICSEENVAGNYSCFQELYEVLKSEIIAGTKTIFDFNNLRNKYLGQ